MRHPLELTLIAALLALGGCASMPSGPGVMVLPGSGKTFDQFRADEFMCRDYAMRQAGGDSPDRVAVDSGVRSAALGTVIGAVAGAAIGGQRGAAVGAGTGLVVGSVAGTGAADVSAYDAQRRYDHAYIQCMYANGHRVPVAGGLSSQPTDAVIPSERARSRSMPPPPPGNPPPGVPRDYRP
jgi:hypothetical protein